MSTEYEAYLNPKTLKPYISTEYSPIFPIISNDLVLSQPCAGVLVTFLFTLPLLMAHLRSRRKKQYNIYLPVVHTFGIPNIDSSSPHDTTMLCITEDMH